MEIVGSNSYESRRETVATNITASRVQSELVARQLQRTGEEKKIKTGNEIGREKIEEKRKKGKLPGWDKAKRGERTRRGD